MWKTSGERKTKGGESQTGILAAAREGTTQVNHMRVTT